jgi:molybdenum cofactor cytidylyltransferase
LLADIGGAPMASCSVKTATRSTAFETIVVTGYESELIQSSLSKYNVKFVFNPNYSVGLSTSLKSGINAVSKNMGGAVVLLGDMPWVTTKTINTLIERFQNEEGKNICRPVYKGLKGNPVLWPRDFFSKIIQIKGDIGAKKIIEKYPKRVSLVEVKDPGILVDINKPGDLNLSKSVNFL